MYGSKVTNNLEDDSSYFEEQEELYPQTYYSRKNNGKGKNYEYYQKNIDELNFCHCPREEKLRDIKPFKRKDIKASSTLKDTSDISMDDSIIKNKMPRTSSKIYQGNEKCNNPNCSIIYYNKIEDYDRTANDCHSPLKSTETQKNMYWIESDLNIYTLPVTKKLKYSSTAHNCERKFDKPESKLKDSFTNVPSILTCDLPDLVERKPEPELLATVFLMSENEDLRKAKPDDIFDKLFSTSKIYQPFTTDQNETVTGSNRVNDHIKMNIINTNKIFTSGNTRIEEFAKENQQNVDTFGSTNLLTTSNENTRDKWMKNDDMLEYMMKGEEAPAYRNYVRLNGSVKPFWFPGYALISPLIPDCIKITSDPDEPLLEVRRLLSTSTL